MNDTGPSPAEISQRAHAHAQARDGRLLDKLLVGKAELSRLLSISGRTIDRWTTDGLMPAPVRALQRGNAGKCLWKVEAIVNWLRTIE